MHVDNICRENVDWRVCGTHGTSYGEGELEHLINTYAMLMAVVLMSVMMLF